VRGTVLMLLCAGCGRVGFDSLNARGDGGGGGDDGGGSDVGMQPIVSNLMFVTSTTVVPGALGGIAAADGECNARAGAVGLPGTYVAYLTTAGVGGADRLAGSRGWQRIDGRPVVDTVADLKNMDLLYPPVLDESGARVPNDTVVVTGTDAFGNAGDSCGEWTNTLLDVNQGEVGWTDANWVAGFYSSCSTSARLYCFGVGNTAAVATPPAGRTAFLAATVVVVAMGSRADADASCQSEATTNGIAGSYLALLPDATTSAISRFDTTKPTWYRLDGAALATSPDAFAAGELLAPLNQYGDRSRIAQDFYAWTGNVLPNAVGSNAGTCESWSRNTSGNSGGIGLPAVLGVTQFASSSQTCSAANAIYCLEK
jgi:hypothetical protein